MRNPTKALPERAIPLCCPEICQYISSQENIRTPKMPVHEILPCELADNGI